MEYSIMLGEKGEGGYRWDICIGKEGGKRGKCSERD